ncbi:MAG: DNA polymerase III subunit alpha [Gemmataceae bacterium]
MAERPFVHLHCHSHYSLLDGASRVPELVQTVKGYGMNAIALTDHGNLYGAIEFYRECQKADIKPILGYEAYVAPGHRTERKAKRRGEASFHLTLLAKNNQGWKNLIKMASIAQLEGYYHVPRIDKEVLEQYSEGIICLSGCASAEFSDLILGDKIDEAEGLAIWFQKLFGENFYIEIQNNGVPIQEECAKGAIDIAQRLGMPLVVTSDAHYLHQNDAPAHDVLLCINTRKARSNPNRMKFATDQFHIRPPHEMYDLFPGHEDAVQRSQEIADGCEVEIDFKARHFPVFTPPDQKTPEDYLRELCEKGVYERYGEDPAEKVWKRLDHELGIINKMGFASYFLITWDFVNFALEKGIPNSARGSGVGALVSYALKFSHVDPLDYDLLFERFLDPNRTEAPDIDIDFCQDRREEVIQYVRDKYGENSVAQIATFGTMAARAAIKDVARVLEIPLDRVNKLVSYIPDQLGITLDQSLEQSPELRMEYERDAQVREVIDIARKLEGTNRNAGTHAAGVVIADGDITDYVPVHRVRSRDANGAKDGDEAVITTQWVMGDLESVGMLKMDFLGLRTLTVLTNAVELIEKTRGIKIDLNKLPLDDKRTYELLQRGDAKGVFQLESEGIRNLLTRMKPDNIRDIIAIMALYRPGPLKGGMVDSYVNRKHGLEQPTYDHDMMKAILEETHGVMCYQEQIMRILNRLGGIDLSKAYKCIKAISKKKHDIINQRRGEFIQGAMEKGVDEKTSMKIFGFIEQFGSYGFNKSHTAAYGHVGYQTAYLKTHYTAEFMAALLTSEIEDGNKRKIMVEHFEDAARLGYPVQAPNVNTCYPDFTVVADKIMFGLVAIKGLGRGAANEIVRGRQEGGAYKDIFDFCERVDQKLVRKAEMEKLLLAGGFDCFGATRSQIEAVLQRAIDSAGALQKDKQAGQLNLFDAFEEAEPVTNSKDVELPNIPEWDPMDKLKKEKEVLDFYFSSHPLAQHEAQIKRFASNTVEEFKHLEHGSQLFLGGMLTQLQFPVARTGKSAGQRFLRGRFEDFSGSCEFVMWSETYSMYKDDIVEDAACFVEANLDKHRNNQLVLTAIHDLDQVQRQKAKGLSLRLNLEAHPPEVVGSIARVLERAPGRTPVFLFITDRKGKRCVMKLGQDFTIDASKLSKVELEDLLGQGGVSFS